MNIKILRRTAWVGVIMLVLIGAPAIAEDGTMVAPIATYETLVLDGQSVQTPGGGVVVLSGDDLIVGTYTRSLYTAAPAHYDGNAYHTIDALYDGGVGRHRVVSLFKAASDRPVAGGWHTFQAATVYGYEVVDRPRTSIVVGGGAAVSDFGIETAGGETWPLIPVPFIRASYESPMIECSLDFITGPNLHVVLAPERDLSMIADMRIDQFRDIRDLVFELSLGYRFLSLGFKNDTFGFAPYDEDESLETFYYAAFGMIDLQILSVTGGYAFGSRMRYEEEVIDNTGDGFFVAVQALIPLGGGGQ